jgi:hypothetical protein
MEGESDSFLKVLQNRSRNYVKKLDRIKKKQAEVKSSGKEMKEEEKKLIESAPLVEELLQDNEKVIELYKKTLETPPKEEKKAAPKVEEDRSIEVVLLWALVEFLSNPQVKDRFIKENASDQQDLEAFLLLHSLVKGQAGKKLSEISSDLENSVKLYLSKSEKIAPGTMKSYKKLAEFEGKFRNWANSQQRPATPPKVDLTIHSTQVYNTEKPVEEKKTEEKKEKVHEVKVESVPEVREVKEVPVENTKIVKESQPAEDDEWAEPPAEKPSQKVTSKWADDNSEDEKPEKKPEAEDDGFVTVTGRKKPTGRGTQEFERRGRGRGGRGRGGRDRGEFRGRGRGRGRGQEVADDS